MLRTRIAVLVCAGSLFATPAIHAQELLVNGGFETGNTSGWTAKILGDVACANAYQVNAIAAASGNFGLSSGLPAAGCIFNSNTVVSQFFNTTPGQQYNLSYIVQQQPGFPKGNCGNVNLGCQNHLDIIWKNHVSPMNIVNAQSTFLDNFPLFGSFLFTNTFTALAATTELEINMWAQRDFWYIDNMSVQAVTLTPEPSTWALMAVGFSAIAVAARRRRNAA